MINKTNKLKTVKVQNLYCGCAYVNGSTRVLYFSLTVAGSGELIQSLRARARFLITFGVWRESRNQPQSTGQKNDPSRAPQTHHHHTSTCGSFHKPTAKVSVTFQHNLKDVQSFISKSLLIFYPRIVFDSEEQQPARFYFPTLTVRKLAITSQALQKHYNHPDPRVISPHLYTINKSERRQNYI